jgi:hypothetical protein
VLVVTDVVVCDVRVLTVDVVREVVVKVAVVEVPVREVAVRVVIVCDVAVRDVDVGVVAVSVALVVVEAVDVVVLTVDVLVVGAVVGSGDGNDVGLDVGSALGDTVGVAVGPADGCVVGVALGASVGGVVGIADGCRLGAIEGAATGALVGHALQIAGQAASNDGIVPHSAANVAQMGRSCTPSQWGATVVVTVVVVRVTVVAGGEGAMVVQLLVHVQSLHRVGQNVTTVGSEQFSRTQIAGSARWHRPSGTGADVDGIGALVVGVVVGAELGDAVGQFEHMAGQIVANGAKTPQASRQLRQ